MCRTSVNLLGNCVASAVVARWEGVKLEEQAEDVTNGLAEAAEAEA